MSFNVHDDVAREAFHDWVANRPPREAPDPQEYADDPDEDRALLDAAIDAYDAGWSE